jgi:hypothetical protein
MMDIEDEQLILHDLRGVNLTVGFFSDIEKSLYSVCWRKVDVRVELCYCSEQISDLTFHFNTQRLFVDDHMISGEVVDFRCEPGKDGVIQVFCKLIINWTN